MSVAQKIINMLLLRTAPQDLPYSIALLGRMIFLYFVTGIIVAGRDEPSLAFGQILLNISSLTFGFV